MATLRIVLCVTLGLWFSTALQPHVSADPPTSPIAASASPTQATLNPTPIDFTLSPHGDILISVKINGNTDATFLLDSGVTGACITNTLAKQLGLMLQPMKGDDGKPRIILGKSAQMVTTSMQLDSIPIASIQLLVIDADAMHLPSLVGQPVDGIIGANVLATLPCFLDFQNHQVSFFLSSPVTPQQRQNLGMQDAVGCPLTINKDSLYMASVQMANGDTTINDNLVIDTGSKVTILSEQSAKQLHLPDIPKSPSHTVFGDLAMSGGKLTSLSFPTAGITLENLSVFYAKKQLPNGIAANLGRDTLSQIRVLLDFGAKMMYLKPYPSLMPSVPAPVPPASPNGK